MARETRETHHEWDVDVLGAFPQPEPTDSEIAVIDNLVERYGDALRTFVLMKRAARATPAGHPGNDSNKCWPKYKCITHGDGVPWGRAFDRLLQRV
jgi:hypothetical protein